MSYIERTIEKKIQAAAGYSPVTMICGPTHVGKTTMLRHAIAKAGIEGVSYVSLRDPESLKLAKEDPLLFFDQYKPPVIVDEIQLAPSLLPVIQYLVDLKQDSGEDNCGMFWLTSTQKFSMMKNVTESLAGRCTLYNISSLSSSEIEGRDAGVFDPDIEELKKRATYFPSKSADEIFKCIYLGGMPGLYSSADVSRDDYFLDYMNLYLSRDVMEYIQIGKISDFWEFMAFLASCTGQELNYLNIARSLGVSAPTVKKWVSVLDALGIIYIIPSCIDCNSKKVIKSSKFYFMDTGLVSYLCGYKSPEDIASSKMAEAFLETYAVSEIVKSYYNAGKIVNLCHYRDTHMREIDLIMQQANKLYPIEIKRNRLPSNPNKDAYVLDKYEIDPQPAITICFTNRLVPCGNNTWLYPISAI